MPKKKIYQLTQEELNNFQLVGNTNKVLVKVHDPILNKTTGSGILMVAPTDMDWNPDIHADRYGIVQKVPETLNFKRMMWETEIEIEYGDLIWYDYLMSLNSDSIFVGEVEYKLMDYQFLYVAKRWDEIVPLNGYCLFEPKEDKLTTKSDLILIHEGRDIRQAKMIYAGRKNKKYDQDWTDECNIEVGDMAIFGMPPIMLEAEYHSLFEGKKQYRISQRRYVLGYIRDDIYPSGDSAVIIPDTPKAVTENGLVIPEPFRKKQNYGTIYKSGSNELAEGDRIHFHNQSLTYIEYNGKEYGLLKTNKILYKFKI